MRLAMPDSGCRSVDVPLPDGRKIRYEADRSGSVEVANPRHARLLREQAECFPASNHTIPQAGGYPCRSCGFASLFVACSRCGTTNPRDGREEPPDDCEIDVIDYGHVVCVRAGQAGHTCPVVG